MKLGTIYEQNRRSGGNVSRLVPLEGIYWNQFKELSRKQNVYTLYTEKSLALGKDKAVIDQEKDLTAGQASGK